MLKVIYHHAKFGGAQISPAAGQPKTTKFICYWQHCVQQSDGIKITVLRG